MIRPFTIATFLLACCSGLYLYQSKHEVQLLDRTIERTVRETGALREQSRSLAVQWTMLTNPERLRQFADTYLHVKTIAPSQFTSLADLNSRLPAPQAETPGQGTAEREPVPMAVESEPQPVPEPTVEDVLPVPPAPVMRQAPAVASMVRPVEARVFARLANVDALARSVMSNDARQSEQRSEKRVAPRPTDAHAAEAHVNVHEPPAFIRELPAPAPRPIVLAVPRPLQPNALANTNLASVSNTPSTPARPVRVAQSGPYGGSLLGMARGAMPAAPRPVPVTASYDAN